MKKLRLLGGVVLAFFPVFLFAQEIQLPSVEIQALRDKVPFRVKEAVLNDFGTGHQPFAWITPQTVYKTDLWEQNVAIDNMEIGSYAIHCKTQKGDLLDALYSPDGKKINSRELYKNFKPSLNLMTALQSSEFEGWGITQDYHLIKRFADGKEKERYVLVMKKGGDKKYLYFDKDGVLISKKNFALAEAEW